MKVGHYNHFQKKYAPRVFEKLEDKKYIKRNLSKILNNSMEKITMFVNY